MSEFTKNKTASIFVTFLIGFIVLSFMFTGYQQFQGGGGSPNAIGKVGDLPIKAEEYQQEFNRQIEFYKQMLGGEISAKQIEAMKNKESTIRNIVQKKLIVKFAGDIGAGVNWNRESGAIDFCLGNFGGRPVSVHIKRILLTVCARLFC